MSVIPQVFNYILNIIVRPIREHLLSFLLVSFMLFLPELKDVSLNLRPLYIFDNLFRHVALSVAIAYVLVWIVWGLSRLNRLLGIIVLWIILLALSLICFGDIFLFDVFDTHVNAYILQLLNETNAEESSEFVSVYLTRWSFVKVLLEGGMIVFVAMSLYIFRKRVRLNILSHWTRISVKCLVVAYLIYCLSYAIYLAPVFSFDWMKNDDKAHNDETLEEEYLTTSFVFRLYQSVLQQISQGESFEKCALAQENIVASIGQNAIKNIVLIIGESYNRHHSNLYGYSKNTCPNLSQLDNLYVFKDVISPVNATTQAFHYFMSLQTVRGQEMWHDTPLFPAIFKHVGYNVVFYSNEFVKEAGMNAYDASCGFFNHPLVEPKLFSHRNERKFKYDGDMIDDYKSKREELEQDSLNFIIFHLYGQHSDYSKRYPADFAHFSSQDYNRPSLNDYQLRELANYDNATSYNDSVVNEIIRMYKDRDAVVLYFADHGEEANDFRDFSGRSRDFDSKGAPCLHCQLDIPFIIYLSDSCRNLHPKLADAIAQAVELPFMTDGLPHLLFDMAEVDYEGFDPSQSPINNRYDSTKSRWVSDYCMEVYHNYDSICAKYGPWSIGF